MATAAHTKIPMQNTSIIRMNLSASEMNDFSCSRGNRMDLQSAAKVGRNKCDEEYCHVG